MERETIPIIYITGAGHSGSTLLNLIMGKHSKIESAGELNNFKAVTDSTICACGASYHDCTYWSSIRTAIAENYGKDIDAVGMNKTQQAIFDEANYPFIKTILDCSGKAVLCESSKIRRRLTSLLDSGLFKVLVVHLVRDGRAVGYSQWKKGKGYYRWVLNWSIDTLRYHFGLKRSGADHINVRYEDIVRDPEKQASLILGRLGLEFEEGQLDLSGTAHHTLRGNRIRRKKSHTIALDTEYLAKLPFFKKLIGTLIGFVALILYKYPLWPAHRDTCHGSGS